MVIINLKLQLQLHHVRAYVILAVNLRLNKIWMKILSCANYLTMNYIKNFIRKTMKLNYNKYSKKSLFIYFIYLNNKLQIQFNKLFQELIQKPSKLQGMNLCFN